jgi:formylglycine-generating enzyme required for sulfatase activity
VRKSSLDRSSLQRLISALSQSQLGLTGREIAEVIWLATQTEKENIITIDVEAETPPNDPNILGDTKDITDSEQEITPSSAEIVLPPVETRSSLALPPNPNYHPIRVQDAPAISQALVLARALRPLARQVALGLPVLLDEIATVNFIAETRVWQPVLKPESELWLDVALVFDTSPSMGLWQRLGVDVHRLLSRYGTFRDVQIWFLQHDQHGQVELTARRQGTARQPSELLTNDRRRLVVVVSDCIAPAWYNDNMRQMIAKWSAKLPTVVFQVFPERLWSRTALVNAVTVEFQAKKKGLPSDRLQSFVRSVWDQERLETILCRADVRLPIVTLEKDVLTSWAKVVAGDRLSRTLGVVWDSETIRPVVSIESSDSEAEIDLLTPLALKNRIDSFLLMSSPISRDLASLLASAPVITLPIIRLIKQSMLPQASAVHIAEVLMSGLLKVSDDQVPTFENAERIAYELVNDQVRDRLRAGSPRVIAFNVFEEVSKYVAGGLNKSVDEFWALLRTPGMSNSSTERAFLRAFATVSARVLRGLGGEFEAIADSLTPQALEAVGFDDQDDFPLQPCEYESATITAILDRFDFETATITQQSRILGFGQKWRIDRKRSFTWGYTEKLLAVTGQELDLEMIAIPAGSFMMGDEQKTRDRELPQHEVTLQSFYLGRYPITQAQWRIVAGYEQINRKLEPNPSRFKGNNNRPVENVSWPDAQEFCQRLSRQTGKIYRLPSEAEWEYACRAGTTTPFHFGETISTELANYDGTEEAYNNGPKGEYRQETTDVGAFPANEWGLHDMHGNVWERCEDLWHKNYVGAPIDGSAWLKENDNDYHLLRGGSWSDDPRDCRSASRIDFIVIFDIVGFRVCCERPRILLNP